MGTEIRPELSDKNPYWIGKHRYYELKHFCLQYPIWKKAYAALDGLSKRPQDLEVFVKSGQLTSDPTARCAESRLFFADRMELVEQAARKYSRLLLAVGESDNSEVMTDLLGRLEGISGVSLIFRGKLGGVITSHAGPGALGIAFVKDVLK